MGLVLWARCTGGVLRTREYTGHIESILVPRVLAVLALAVPTHEILLVLAVPEVQNPETLEI